MAASDLRLEWVPESKIEGLKQRGSILLVLPSGLPAREMVTIGGTPLSSVIAQLGRDTFTTDSDLIVIKENAIVRRALSFDPRYTQWNSRVSELTLEPGDIVQFSRLR